jgi:hypothetical protein
MSGKKHQSADNITLIPPNDFKRAVRQVLSNTKAQSDKQLAAFQASNLKKREAKKHK